MRYRLDMLAAPGIRRPLAFLVTSGSLCATAQGNAEEALQPTISATPSAQLRLFPERSERTSSREEFPYTSRWAPSAALELQAGAHSGDDRFQLQAKLFGRVDARDGARSHADLREAYVLHSASWVELQVGVAVIFWGVAESRHLVDIVNQSDLLESLDEQVKLGQPLWRLSLRSTSWGTLSLFALPVFRERRFPGRTGRPSLVVPINEKAATFSSDRKQWQVGAAIRWSNSHDAWDWGISYFHGTSREPQLSLQPLPGGAPSLVPHYDLIHQSGLDLQWTGEAWLWKLESIWRQGQGEAFLAGVGGFEYTLFDLSEGSDVGIVVEGGYDGRNNDARVVMDHDAFAALRWTLNDIQSTEFLLGAMVDVVQGATVLRIEGKRRLGNSLTLSLNSYFFLPSEATDLVRFLDGESYLSLDLSLYL